MTHINVLQKRGHSGGLLMKKYFTTFEYKKYHRFYSKKSHLQKVKRKGKVQNNARVKQYQDKLEEMKYAYTPLYFPANFSIVHNTDEVLSFFDEFQNLINLDKPVDLHMENVIQLTPDAILYLISIFKENNAQNKQYRVKGNAPNNETARELFVKSGFYGYVKSEIKTKREDTRVFMIREGNNCLPKVAKSIVEYSRSCLGSSIRTKETKDVYPILIEVMTNTHNHASEKKDATWYLMAQHMDDEVHFAFLDSGLGIPHTLKKNFSETIFNMISSGKITDRRLIKAALDGKFKTQTGERKRGKGLPKIMKIAQEGTVKDSIIISNLGYINCSNGITKRLKGKFHGTLFSWKITKG